MAVREHSDRQGASEPLRSPVFLVGCARSGTTWLQSMLSQHPAVASAPETDLFAGYLALLDKRYCFETHRRETGLARTGIQRLLAPSTFDGWLKALADDVLTAVLAQKPGGAIVLEKTPHNVLHVPLILRLFPEARFVHLVRDPRAVVASLRSAAGGWGANWAEKGAIAGAWRWREHVGAGLAIPERTAAYREVFYEALRQDPARELMALFEWLGLNSDADRCREYVEGNEIGKLRSGTQVADVTPSADTGGFFRSGQTEGWRDELSVIDVAAIEREVGPMMRRLGYVTVSDRSIYNRVVARPCAGVLSATRRGVGACRWRVDRLLTRVERSL